MVTELTLNVFFFCSGSYSKQKETNDAGDAPQFLERYFCLVSYFYGSHVQGFFDELGKH